MKSQIIIRPTEVKKAVRECRYNLTAALMALELEETTAAFAALERAQHAAFEAKSLVINGGKYEDGR